MAAAPGRNRGAQTGEPAADHENVRLDDSHAGSPRPDAPTNVCVKTGFDAGASAAADGW